VLQNEIRGNDEVQIMIPIKKVSSIEFIELQFDHSLDETFGFQQPLHLSMHSGNLCSYKSQADTLLCLVFSSISSLREPRWFKNLIIASAPYLKLSNESCRYTYAYRIITAYRICSEGASSPYRERLSAVRNDFIFFSLDKIFFNLHCLPLSIWKMKRVHYWIPIIQLDTIRIRITKLKSFSILKFYVIPIRNLPPRMIIVTDFTTACISWYLWKRISDSKYVWFIQIVNYWTINCVIVKTQEYRVEKHPYYKVRPLIPDIKFTFTSFIFVKQNTNIWIDIFSVPASSPEDAVCFQELLPESYSIELLNNFWTTD